MKEKTFETIIDGNIKITEIEFTRNKVIEDIKRSFLTSPEQISAKHQHTPRPAYATSDTSPTVHIRARNQESHGYQNQGPHP